MIPEGCCPKTASFCMINSSTIFCLVLFQRIPYEQPSTKVFEVSIERIVCVSDYDTRSMEDPTAPGQDKAW
jgi:hypothetical protein